MLTGQQEPVSNRCDMIDYIICTYLISLKFEPKGRLIDLPLPFWTEIIL